MNGLMIIFQVHLLQFPLIKSKDHQPIHRVPVNGLWVDHDLEILWVESEQILQAL